MDALWCLKQIAKYKGRHGISGCNLPECLHPFVFEENIRHRKRPRTSSFHLKQMSAALQWSQSCLDSVEFVQQLQTFGSTLSHKELQTTLIGWFYKQSKSNCTGEDFLKYQALMNKTFRLRAETIAVYLGTSQYATNASCVPGMNAALRFLRSRDGYSAEKEDIQERRKQLAECLKQIDSSLAEVERLWAARTRLNRFDSFPAHPDFTPATAAQNCKYFLKTHQNVSLRKRLLQQELESWSDSPRFASSSAIALAFINGDCDVDVSEAAAMTVIERFLKDRGGNVYFCNKRYEMETLAKECYFTYERTWQEAVEVVKERVEFLEAGP